MTVTPQPAPIQPVRPAILPPGQPAALPTPPASPLLSPSPCPPRSPTPIQLKIDSAPSPTPPILPLPPPVRSTSAVQSSYNLCSCGFPTSPDALLSYVGEHPEPNSYRDAVTSPDSEIWMDAMDKEFQAHMGNKTWKLVPPPPNARIVGTRWVYKLKDENPTIAKARFVAKGFSQQHRINYDETYAPVVKLKHFESCFKLQPTSAAKFTKWMLSQHS
jgi:hypothetical protein